MKTVILVSRCAWTLYNFRSGLIRELMGKGYTVIGAGGGGDGFEKKIEQLGIPFKPLPVPRKAVNPFADLWLLMHLYWLYRFQRPDVVHHFTIKPVIYGSLAAKLAGVPTILNTVTGLGCVFIEKRMAWLRRLVQWQYRLALCCATFTFFQNADDLELFRTKRLVREDRAGLLPGSGVDCEACAPRWPDEHSSVRMRFLLVARLLREKGVYDFVEAARLIKAEYPQAEFHLLGRRDDRNPSVVPAADIAQWQQEGLLTWLGEVEDVRPVVAQSDVVVLPSYREGAPRALLEAAAMGKPVIATDTVGCRDVVDHGVTGLLIPVQNPRALADAMRQLLAQPEIVRPMGLAGRAKMQRQFDERVVIRKIMSLYTAETV